MNDPLDSEFVPVRGPGCSTESLLREYLDELFAALDRDRIRDSCARERALASVVRGIVEPLASDRMTSLTHRDLAEIAFGELEDYLGWFGEDAAILGLYAGLWPAYEEESHRVAEERFNADPYSRHAAYWHRCVEAGYADLTDWNQARDDRNHMTAVTVIEGAAEAVGDE